MPEGRIAIKAQRGPDSEDFVHVGHVAKAHGIRGEVKVFAFSGVPDDFTHYPEVTLLAEVHGGLPRVYAVSRCRSQGKFAILQLDGVTDRNEAEMLQGAEVQVPRDVLSVEAEGDFSWHAVMGKRVMTEDGRELGKVVDILATGAHDILVVTGGGREYLIPANPQFIASQDKAAGTIVVTPVPGLLEINE